MKYMFPCPSVFLLLSVFVCLLCHCLLGDGGKILTTLVLNKYGLVTYIFIYAVVAIFKMFRICLVMPEWPNSVSDHLVHVGLCSCET
jgi:hypothetical protein